MATRAMILIVPMTGFQELLGNEIDATSIVRIAFIFFVIDLLINISLKKEKG